MGIPSAMMMNEDGRDEDEEEEDDLDLGQNDNEDDEEEEEEEDGDEEEEFGDSPAERIHRSRSCAAVLQGNTPSASTAMFEGMGATRRVV
jgi:hypothetical protein